MPLSQAPLTLEASPRSVQDARRWAGEVCRELGREELTESAEMGVSELVTNALLHAAPPIAVRVRGTRLHPRVEVLDGSVTPPAPNPNMTDEDELLSTIGRGLGLVAMCSTAWGAYVEEDGKIVWFEPADGLVEEPDLDGTVFETGPTGSGPLPRARVGEGLEVRFPNLPVRLYVDWRRHFRDLQRELRLLSLAHESDYPVAKTLSELFVRFEEEVRQASGLDVVEQAIEGDVETADIRMVIGPDAPAVMAQMIDVLELADAFCRTERLLSLASTDQQRDFQHWFLGQFVSQGGGTPPVRWSGDVTVAELSRTGP